jgi:phosphatidylglycerophosphatase A
MKLSFFDRIIGSGFYSGYVPVAPGTFGSLAALLIYLIPGFENLYILITAILLSIVVGVPVATKFEKYYNKTDPRYCTIDEFAGMWITLIMVPKEVIPVTAAFFIWRIMDIIKPYPARKLEELSGGWGVMMDDITAGAYSLLFVHVFLLIFR